MEYLCFLCLVLGLDRLALLGHSDGLHRLIGELLRMKAVDKGTGFLL